MKQRLRRVIGLIPFIILFISILFGVYNAPTIYKFLSRASGEKANISIDAASDIGPLRKPWRNLAQGGEDHNWRMGNLVGNVRSLEPMYIRIDHIYDFYDIVRNDGGTLTFHWDSFDQILNDILATGAKPFISLSYMPPAIAKDGDITGLPNNWGEYQTVIQRTIQHVSKDRGIEDVYYEVWNEPDLFGGFKVYGDKNYLTLYATAARGASQVQGAKSFKFGGPATTALYRNWFDGLSKFASENDVRLDFISWHKYSEDIDIYKKDMSNANLWLQSFPKLANTELLITEWGHDSDINSGYDSGYSAAHTAAVATELVGIIDKAFVFEIQDGKDPGGKEYWGRWGLFTHNDFGAKAKPRFRALRMLGELNGTQLKLLGKGSWVKALASRDGNDITLLLANYDPAGFNSEDVPVTVFNLPQSGYHMEITYLDGLHASHDFLTQEGKIVTSVPMRANSVAVVKFTPASL